MSPFPPPAELTIRQAVPDDAPALGLLWARAFPGERSAEDRTESLLEGTDTFGDLGTCFVGEIGGRLAGAFRAYELVTHLFGRPVPTLGLGAVAVSPEFRRRGIGQALCEEALRLGRGRGDLLSLLYPFRVDFYRRLGWAMAGSFHRYRFAPEDLPLFQERDRVRILEVGDRIPRISELYDALLGRRHGLLERGPKSWRRLDDPALLVIGVEAAPGTGNGSGDGATPKGGGAGGPSPLAGAAILEVTRGRRGSGAGLRLREIHVTDAASYRALLGWLSAQRDQWRRVTWDALPGERLHEVLAHPRLPGTGARRGLWFESARILRGPMVRILDFEGLARTLGVAQSGTPIDLADEQLPEQSGRWVPDGEGGLRRSSADPGSGALPISVASGLLVRGELRGVGRVAGDFRPVMGIADFHPLDTF